jgi:hypothetical protein
VVYILEEAVDKIITRYSHFDEIAEAINQFILENTLPNNDEKASKESKLEIQLEMEKVADSADKRKSSDTIERKTKKKVDKDSKKESKDSKKKDKDNRKLQGKAIIYSLQEEQLLAENFYKSSVDYEQLFSYSLNPNKEAVYEQGKVATAYSDVQDEQISTVEASETMREVQFAALLGAKTEVSYIKRKKMATWTMFNSAEFRMFETMHGLTRDVDYSKTF